MSELGAEPSGAPDGPGQPAPEGDGAAASGGEGPRLRPRKQHPSAVLFDLFRSARGFLVPGAMVLLLARGDRREVWLMALFVPATLVQLVRYWTLRYEVRGGELVLSEGLLNRNVRNVPLERVQDLDTRQGPLHRLLGVASVRLRTATEGTPEVELSALSLGAIAELRGALLAARRRGAQPEPAPADAAQPDGAGPRPLELRLGTHALVRLALVRNRGLLALGALFAFLSQYGLWEGAERLLGERLLGGLPEPVASLVGVGMFLLGLVACLLLSPLFSIPWTLLRYGDFRLRLDGDDLRIEKGWWTRTSVTLPRKRIQRVSVVESPLQRLFGVVSVHAVNAGRAGGDESATGSAELVPILDRELAGRFLATFVPAFAWADAWRPPHPRTRTRLRRRVWITAVLVGAVGWGALGPGAALLALVYLALADWRARRRAGWLAWQRDEARVAAREGAFVRRVVVAPVQKLQTIQQRESPFDRRWGMRHLVLDTAGGSAVGALELGYLEQGTGAELAGELVEAVDASRFRW